MNYILLFFVSFIQNMAFTWVSRSRNSGDLKSHAVAATFSNGIWFLCNYFILFPEMSKIIQSGDIWDRLFIMAIYVSSTVLGSVLMMAINLGRIKVPKFLSFLVETGKRKVGSV